jgi:hypothetical protein
MKGIISMPAISWDDECLKGMTAYLTVWFGLPACLSVCLPGLQLTYTKEVIHHPPHAGRGLGRHDSWKLRRQQHQRQQQQRQHQPSKERRHYQMRRGCVYGVLCRERRGIHDVVSFFIVVAGARSLINRRGWMGC